MELLQILEDFNRTKEKIRNQARFKVETFSKYDGLSMAIAYSDVIEYVVEKLFNLTSEIMGKNKQKVGVFLYGSLGRREMVCESDLDVMLVYRDESKKYRNFKNKFRELVEPFKFCKIDIPEWGTMEEVKTFVEKSITEGNQILESRFICGDGDIRKYVELIQKKYGGPERMTKNIVFQKFYFEQYYRQRIRNGAINVKYCDGGSRDYLFLHWFNQLMSRKYSDWNKAQKERPVVEQGLSNLYNNGLISSLDFSRAIDALHFNLLFRNEILLVNKGTPDEGLTFLDGKTLDSVFNRMPELMERYGIKSPKELFDRFNKQRFYIMDIKKRIWDLMIDEKENKHKNTKWVTDFHKAYSPLTHENERASFLFYKDLLMKIATIWGSTNSNQTNLLERICEKEKDSDSWEVQASITASPYCPPEYLHHIATGLGKEAGYGYILRIISRNPNVKIKTLEAIANDSKVDARYIQCAKAALEQGKDAANHQI